MAFLERSLGKTGGLKYAFRGCGLHCPPWIQGSTWTLKERLSTYSGLYHPCSCLRTAKTYLYPIQSPGWVWSWTKRGSLRHCIYEWLSVDQGLGPGWRALWFYGPRMESHCNWNIWVGTHVHACIHTGPAFLSRDIANGHWPSITFRVSWRNGRKRRHLGKKRYTGRPEAYQVVFLILWAFTKLRYWDTVKGAPNLLKLTDTNIKRNRKL